ncbi:MAG: glycosyltransferase family 1 protein [Planctomycetes bacterium]|nr:glycosyltransferase family 1 protein [Planctomycetota bacterium]
MAAALTVFHLNTERTWRGGEGQTLALASGLARRGHRSVVVAQRGGELARRAAAAGLPTQEVAMRGEWDVVAVRHLAQLLGRERPHIVHMHTSHAHMLGVIASKWTGIGKRVVSRRVDFSIHRHALSLSGLKYRFGVDRYIAISEAVRRQLVKDGVDAARIALVASGVDPARCVGGDAARARADLGVPAGVPLIGTIAHFGWHKSLETLIAAAAAIVAELPDARIAVIGDGELRPKLEAERAKSAVADRVLMPGFRANVGDFLAAFDLFVMPSVMEGLCTSILDAFAVGVPVVASRAGGIPELVVDDVTGCLVNPEDPAALAAAVVAAWRDPSRRERWTTAARARLHQRFTHDSMVEGTLAVYRELLDPSAPAR